MLTSEHSQRKKRSEKQQAAVNWFSAFEEKEIMKEMDRKFGQRETKRVKRSASKSSSYSRVCRF